MENHKDEGTQSETERTGEGKLVWTQCHSQGHNINFMGCNPCPILSVLQFVSTCDGGEYTSSTFLLLLFCRGRWLNDIVISLNSFSTLFF